MKKKEYYYVDRDGNYHRRTRKAGSHGTRHDPFPWVGLMLAVALLAGTAGAFNALNHRAADQTMAAAPQGGRPTMRVEVEAGPLELDDNAAVEAPQQAEETAEAVEAETETAPEGADDQLPSADELFHDVEAADAADQTSAGSDSQETGESPAAESSPMIVAFGEAGDDAGAASNEASADDTEAEASDPVDSGDAGAGDSRVESAREAAADKAGAGSILPERDDPAFLPIVEGAETERRAVAIVIESCGNTANLEAMLALLAEKGGAVTLCPAGENLSDERLVSALKAAAEGGAEIEAMDWSTRYLYQMTDREMAEAIWNEGRAISAALGTDYQPHFYRMRDSRAEADQRAHDYLDQLGYRAVLRGTAASWTMAAVSLKQYVQPGAVLLFKTGKTELKNLKELLPWLVSEGYALVTLNDLFGLPANETAPLAEAEMPEPRAFAAAYHTLREGDYGYDVLTLQNRLKELGLLAVKDATACYAEKTVAAVRAFQKEEGLEVTGEADPETQRRLLGDGGADASTADESAPESDDGAAARGDASEAEPEAEGTSEAERDAASEAETDGEADAEAALETGA